MLINSGLLTLYAIQGSNHISKTALNNVSNSHLLSNLTLISTLTTTNNVNQILQNNDD